MDDPANPSPDPSTVMATTTLPADLSTCHAIRQLMEAHQQHIGSIFL